MEGAEHQQIGWLSWVRQSLWGSGSPAPPADVPTATTTTTTRGNDTPSRADDNSSSSSVSRAEMGPRRPPRSEPRRKRTGSSSDGGGEKTRRVSRRRLLVGTARAEEEKRLRKNLPLIWTFFRDREGWSYVKNTWDVGGPAGRADGGGEVVHQAGPMPQTQVGCRLKN